MCEEPTSENPLLPLSRVSVLWSCLPLPFFHDSKHDHQRCFRTRMGSPTKWSWDTEHRLDVLFHHFVATWTVLHLNVPSPEETHWQIQLRKAKWMFAAIIVPEVVTASAFVQWVAARQSIQVMKALGREWSMQHAFFLDMGGLWLHPKDSKPFPINAAQLSFLLAEGYLDMPKLTKKEIWDKSKADKFAKLLACGQIGWLIMETIGRAAQHLPITTLEIGTLGFSVPSLVTFFFWFHKPHDIEVPSMLAIDDKTVDLLERLSPTRYAWRQTPLDFIDKVNSPSITSEIILKAKFWPGQSRYIGPSTRIRNDIFALKYSKLDQLVVFLVWVAYAGIHFSAWRFDFPSHVEMLLWRIATVAMTASMVVFWITSNRKSYLLISLILPSKRSEMEKISNERTKVSSAQILTGAVTVFTYLVARFCLIVQVFLCLRKEPKGAFETVEWTNLLPHV